MTDPRIARTRGKLHAALRAVCVDKPLDQASVSDIVARAGIARTTFYLHYPDLNALAVDACAELVRQAVEALHARADLAAEPPPELGELFVAVRANASLYRSLLRPGGGGPLGELLHRELAERSRSEREKRLPEAGNHELAAAAIAAAFTGLLADWLHGQVPGAPAELSAQTWRLLISIHAAVT